VVLGFSEGAISRGGGGLEDRLPWPNMNVINVNINDVDMDATSSFMERFRKAVEARDVDALEACLAENVVFFSPVVFKRYEGRAAVSTLLRAVMRVFEEFEYIVSVQEGARTALEFKAKVGAREIHGIDLGTVDANGLVTELTVFVRPFTAAQALGEAMRKELGFMG